MVDNLVFQYFFQIGSGLAAGIGAAVLPGMLLYRFITKRMNKREEVE